MMFLAVSLPTFQRLFPSFQTQCTTLYTLLLPVAIVLLVVGVVSAMRTCRTPRSMIRPIINTMLIVMAIALWGDWTDTARDSLKTVVEKMDANPQQAAQKYIDVLVSKEDPQQKGGWFGLPSASQMYEAILWGILSLVGLMAEFLIWAAYILQQFFVGLAYAFAPVFLGFLALRSTSNIGVRFIMGTVGIISWPLGWAAASIGTSNLIDVATEQGLVMSGAYSLQTILAGAVIGGWIIITTLIAPMVIQTAISSGANVGSALMGSALTAGAAAMSAGATTAATLASGGSAASAMAAGGGLAAATSLAGAVMQGGGTSLSGSEVQSIAFNMARRGGASSSRRPDSNDPQSGASQSPPPASTPYNPKDVGNDTQVANMLRHSAQEGSI